MNTRSEKVELHRRHFVSAAAVTVAAAAMLRNSIASGYAQARSEQKQEADIGFFEIDKDITLRRMVVRNSRSERDCPLPAWISRDPVCLEGHFAGACRRLRSPRFRLARLWSFIETNGRQILLFAQGLRACSGELHRESGHRHVEAHDLRDGYRSSAGASPGPGKTRRRADDHRWRLRAVRQARLHV